MQYFFLLGTTPELSLSELKAVAPEANLSLILPRVVSLELSSDEEALKIFNTLGGCVKLLRSEGAFSELSQDGLLQHVVAYLAQFDRPTFNICWLGETSQDSKLDLTTVKKALKEKNVSSRFREGDKDGLSAAVLLHHPDTVELNVLRLDESSYFARTISVQDIDDWTRRDRQKPFANHAKGMLPPKIARVMVNLAGLLGQDPKVLYDPFCGTGTILLEGMHTGWQVLGSDLDPSSASGAQKNCEWYSNTYPTEPAPTFTVFHSDVHLASTPLKQNLKLLGQLQVDAIVTEPFLGRQTPRAQELDNVFKGLEKLYLGAFKVWQSILKTDGKVVIVLPRSKASPHTWLNLVDRLSSFGYTPVSDPLVYARPGAVIEREIWIFKKG